MRWRHESQSMVGKDREWHRRPMKMMIMTCNLEFHPGKWTKRGRQRRKPTKRKRREEKSDFSEIFVRHQNNITSDEKGRKWWKCERILPYWIHTVTSRHQHSIPCKKSGLTTEYTHSLDKIILLLSESANWKSQNLRISESQKRRRIDRESSKNTNCTWQTISVCLLHQPKRKRDQMFREMEGRQLRKRTDWESSFLSFFLRKFELIPTSPFSMQVLYVWLLFFSFYYQVEDVCVLPVGYIEETNRKSPFISSHTEK